MDWIYDKSTTFIVVLLLFLVKDIILKINERTDIYGTRIIMF